MLLSSSLQRHGIAQSAAVHGFDVFPSFYGSDVIEDASARRLLEMPETQRSTKRQKQLTAVLNAAAQAYPDVRFTVDFVLQPNQSSNNPAYGLVSKGPLVNEAWVQKNCVEPLDNRIDAFVDTVDESASQFSTFTTDHHWTLERALQSYNRIADAWGLAPAVWDDSKAVLVSSSWYGSYTRKGLDANYASSLIDQGDDFSNLTFRTLKTQRVLEDRRSGLRDAYLAGQPAGEMEHDRFTSLYMSYYGESNAEIVNSGQNNGRTCLLVGDSFSLCLKRYIASNYERTICLLPGNKMVKRSLSRYIEDYEVDDVIVMMHPQKCSFIAKESPRFMRIPASQR